VFNATPTGAKNFTDSVLAKYGYRAINVFATLEPPEFCDRFQQHVQQLAEAAYPVPVQVTVTVDEKAWQGYCDKLARDKKSRV